MPKKRKFIRRIISFVLVFSLAFGCGYTCSRYAERIKRFFMPPTVSVLMSTYNRAYALPTAIESILGQTYRDFEFIIINDGSGDETDKVVDFYAKRDPRIVYLKNEENKGLIYSLNRGIDIARGKYIARMDDDDRSVPFRFEQQVKVMEEHPEITVLGGGILGKKSVPLVPEKESEIVDPDSMEIDSYFSSALAHPTIFIRRAFLKDNGIYYNKDNLYAEDCGLYKDVLDKGGKISAIPEGVVYLGFYKDVSRPEKYHHTQGETFKKVQKEKLAPFFDAPYDMLGAFKSVENKCEILKKMAAVNPEKKILNQMILEQKRDDTCAYAEDMQDSILVEHPYWKDHIVVKEGNKFFRLDARSETGTIEREKKGTVILRWKSWPPERYEVKSDKHYVYKEDLDKNVKKPIQ